MQPKAFDVEKFPFYRDKTRIAIQNSVFANWVSWLGGGGGGGALLELVYRNT